MAHLKGWLVLLFLCLQALPPAIATDHQGLKWLAKNAKQPGVKTSYSGYQYKLLKKGHGVVSPAGGRSRVKCHYEGRLIDGTVFDSTYDTGEPFEFYPIRAMDAWFPILMDMVVGDVYELYLTPESAAGDSGHAGAKIPADKVVIFKLELVEVVGKHRSALKCSPTNVGDMERHCNEMERDFIDEIKGKSKEELIELKEALSLEESSDAAIMEGFYRRLHILELILDPSTKPRHVNLLGKTKVSEARKISREELEDKEL
jgi:hypothetical protein